jgi:hypothetical protein
MRWSFPSELPFGYGLDFDEPIAVERPLQLLLDTRIAYAYPEQQREPLYRESAETDGIDFNIDDLEQYDLEHGVFQLQDRFYCFAGSAAWQRLIAQKLLTDQQDQQAPEITFAAWIPQLFVVLDAVVQRDQTATATARRLLSQWYYHAAETQFCDEQEDDDEQELFQEADGDDDDDDEEDEEQEEEQLDDDGQASDDQQGLTSSGGAKRKRDDQQHDEADGANDDAQAAKRPKLDQVRMALLQSILAGQQDGDDDDDEDFEASDDDDDGDDDDDDDDDGDEQQEADGDGQGRDEQQLLQAIGGGNKLRGILTSIANAEFGGGEEADDAATTAAQDIILPIVEKLHAYLPDPIDDIAFNAMHKKMKASPGSEWYGTTYSSIAVFVVF